MHPNREVQRFKTHFLTWPYFRQITCKIAQTQSKSNFVTSNNPILTFGIKILVLMIPTLCFYKICFSFQVLAWNVPWNIEKGGRWMIVQARRQESALSMQKIQNRMSSRSSRIQRIQQNTSKRSDRWRSRDCCSLSNLHIGWMIFAHRYQRNEKITMGIIMHATQFTANLQRLKEFPADEQPSTSQSREPRRSSIDKDKTIFNPDCLFCYKRWRKKVKGLWTTEDMKVFEHGGGETVIKLADQKGDCDLGRSSGFDLFACEAKYHPSCRRNCQLSRQGVIARQRKCPATSSPGESAPRGFCKCFQW